MRLSGEQLSQIANELAHLKAEHYGKGPTQVKAYQNGNVVLVVMRGGMTTVERTLIKGGDEKLVQQVRLRFQEQMDSAFTGVVEQIAGCGVSAYASQVTFDPDYIFEIVVLDSGESSEASDDG